MLELFTFADTCARWGISSRLREALNEGKDVHTMVAETAHITRDLAKVLNYGGMGGMGAATMQGSIEKQTGVLMPIPEIKRAMAGWKRTWPEVQRYWAHNTLDERGPKYFVTNPQSGRSRLAFYCAAQNFGFQGPGGDIIKLAIEKCHAAGLPVVAALHDQLLADVPVAEAKEAGGLLGKLMQEAQQEICPNVRAPLPVVHTFDTRWASK